MSKTVDQQIASQDNAYNVYAYAAKVAANPLLPITPAFVTAEIAAIAAIVPSRSE